eukprot:TRINITY_DN15933_c0_g1_i1.p1 TRINITY_DN15933_c0_g1~~TRINITY_DN15933_c0_g1_i1.p1  ORF type:complete len:179 (+),score=24.12 TRINITY_DN15933_c0_g1_i1:729-1265(+)
MCARWCQKVELASPNASYAFVFFNPSSDRSGIDNGYVWRKWLQENPRYLLDPTTGEPVSVTPEVKAIWSNLYREKPERDRRDILNTPKSWLHELRKAAEVPEFYAVRASQLRTISGCFTKGKEDVTWKGKQVATFHTVDGVLEVQWCSKEVLNNILGPVAGASWNVDEFLNGWERFKT